MKFENTWTGNWGGAMRGMRFPMKGSGDTQDSIIGEKDLDLARRLWRASELDNLAHSKYLRQISVSVDISAPLYFWSEMDTYKVGTTANSESTMHKLTKDAKNLSLEDFEIDPGLHGYFSEVIIPKLQEISAQKDLTEIQRLRFLKQILPTSYIQKRHWTANYEVVRNIYNQRHKHRLEEWFHHFVAWVNTLPYAEEFILRKIESELPKGKYRKTALVDAVLYEPGMEDGFVCYSIGESVEQGRYYDKNGPLPKNNRVPAIKTLEGFHIISEGDYILTGVQGERWPCKPDIFKSTYELV